MPELPEVETTVRGLAALSRWRADRSRGNPSRRPAARHFPPISSRRLTGATVTGLSRRAKYGLIHTDRERTLVFHLGMSGRWRIDPEEIGKHDHLVLRDRSRSRAGAVRPAPVRLGRSGRQRCARRTGRRSPRSAPSRSGRGSPRSTCATSLAGRGRLDQAACCSTSGSSRGSATSTSARRCSGRGSIREEPPVRSRCPR